MDEKPQPTPLLRTRNVVIAAGAVVLAGLSAVYLTNTPADNGPSDTSTERPSADGGDAATSSKTAGATVFGERLNKGEVKAFVYRGKRMTVEDFSFVDGNNEPLTLSSFKGKVVLLNLWATWCAPCRHEMPALDRLQGQLGSDKFEVVALSLDRAGLEPSKAFLKEIKVENLKAYADPTTKASAPLKVIGMPTTILLDAEGLEVGRLVGPAE